MAGQRSLVLITVDCLRADRVGLIDRGRATTPFLDSLAQDSFVLPTAIVGGSPTYYSFPTILASRHPLALGRDVVGLAPGEMTLASVLQKSGLATAAFVAGNPYISRQFGYDQGFDTFRDFLDASAYSPTDHPAGNHRGGLSTRLNRSLEKLCHHMGPLGAAYDELYFQYCQRIASPRASSLDVLRRFPSADVIVDLARAWLVSVGQSPFFLWLHLMDPHAPYCPTEKALSLTGHGELSAFQVQYLNSCWNRSDLSPERFLRERGKLIALYDSCVRWVDAQVARLVDALRSFHRWDDCTFVLTADHGEEFFEHSGRYHPPSTTAEEIIHVPLLVRSPVLKKRELPKQPFSHLHLAPTLLEAMSVPCPSEFTGRSVWPLLEKGGSWEDPAIVESVGSCTNPLRAETRLGGRVLTVREARYKLVLHFHPYEEDLIDLEADPQERNPIPSYAEKSTRRRLLEYAFQHLEHSLQTQYPAPRLRARLRDLRLEFSKTQTQAQRQDIKQPA